MSACGLRSPVSTRSRIGIANAAVFPVPVCACAKRSRPERRIGMAWACTGVGAMKPSSSIAFATSGWISSSPKDAVSFTRAYGSFVFKYRAICSVRARIVPHRAHPRHRRSRAPLLAADLLHRYVLAGRPGLPVLVPDVVAAEDDHRRGHHGAPLLHQRGAARI